MESTTTPRVRRPLQVKASPAPAGQPAPTAVMGTGNEVDIWDSAIRIDSVARILFWIEGARQVLDGIQFYADQSPQLRALLDCHKIRYRSADWTDELSDALQMLHLLQMGDARDAYKAVSGHDL